VSVITDALGARLVAAGIVSRAQLQSAVAEESPRCGGALALTLCERGLSEHRLAAFFLSEGYGPLQGPEDFELIHASTLARIPGVLAREVLALPLGLSVAGLVVAMADPSDTIAIATLRRHTGHPILPTVARPLQLRHALERCYPDAAGALGAGGRGETAAEGRLEGALPEAERPERGSSPPAGPSAAEARRGTGSLPAHPTADEGVVWGLVRRRRSQEGAGADGEAAEGDRDASPEPTATGEQAGSGRPPGSRSSHKTLSFEAPSPDAEDVPVSAAELPDIGPELARLREAPDRDALVRIACDAGRSVARTVVFLARRKDILQGWDGSGRFLSRGALRNLWVPTTSPSVLRVALTNAAGYDGPYGHTTADRLFRSAIGGRGARVVVEPVIAHERAIGLLCADDVRFGALGQQRIEELARAMARRFEHLLRR
jgi:hypothetical protein